MASNRFSINAQERAISRDARTDRTYYRTEPAHKFNTVTVLIFCPTTCPSPHARLATEIWFGTVKQLFFQYYIIITVN